MKRYLLLLFYIATISCNSNNKDILNAALVLEYAGWNEEDWINYSSEIGRYGRNEYVRLAKQSPDVRELCELSKSLNIPAKECLLRYIQEELEYQKEYQKRINVFQSILQIYSDKVASGDLLDLTFEEYYEKADVNSLSKKDVQELRMNISNGENIYHAYSKVRDNMVPHCIRVAPQYIDIRSKYEEEILNNEHEFPYLYQWAKLTDKEYKRFCIKQEIADLRHKEKTRDLVETDRSSEALRRLRAIIAPENKTYYSVEIERLEQLLLGI